jgi:hypothetical protein
MQFLTPDLIGRIANALGLGRAGAETAISAAVPALLASFSSAAEKPGGAQRLAEAIKQQSGVLDSFSSTIGSDTQSSFIGRGTNLLSSVLGGQDQSALAGAIAKFAGLGQGASSSLLGLLAPVVMGTIGRQFGPRGPDAGGLANLLSGQQSQIAQAIPSALGKLLGGTGLLDSIGGATTTAAAAAAAADHAGRAATYASGQAAQFASSSAHSVGSAAHTIGSASYRAADAAKSGAPAWIYWAIPLALIAGLAWYLLANSGDRAVQEAATATQPAATTGVAVSGIDLGRQLGDSLGSLRASLQGVTDVESARAALPKFREVTAQVDKASGMVGQLSTTQRRAVAGQISPVMQTLNQLFDKVLAIPGVSEVLKPAIDSLRTKLTTLTA